MPKRITILMDDDLYKKLKELQAKKIWTRTATSISFSKVVNETLRKSLNY